MKSRDACKAFWRRCIEHHAFFRLEMQPQPAVQPRILKRGSTFRYRYLMEFDLVQIKFS